MKVPQSAYKRRAVPGSIQLPHVTASHRDSSSSQNLILTTANDTLKMDIRAQMQRLNIYKELI